MAIDDLHLLEEAKNLYILRISMSRVIFAITLMITRLWTIMHTREL
jgi:hypothetical protein